MVLLLHLGLMYCSIGCKVSEAHPKLPAHQTVCPHQTRYCGKKKLICLQKVMVTISICCIILIGVYAGIGIS